MGRAKRMGLSFIPIPALLVLVALLHFTVNPSASFEPAWLLPITNAVFVTVICFIVAYIALRDYRFGGRIQVLLLGCGVLVFGIGGLIAGFARNVPGTGANLNVTIYNLGALISAVFHFVAALILLAGVSPGVGAKRKSWWLIFGYGGVTAVMGLITAASFKGFIPPFFIQQIGPTGLRQSVLGTSAVLFAFSFIAFLTSYRRSRETFLYWYSCALALTAISLTAFLMENSVGSFVGWAGRVSQYLGGVYFLTAVIAVARNAQVGGKTLDSLLAASFSPAEEKFRALAENAPDIIRRFDRDVRHIYVNAAGLRFYGKPAHSIVGRTLEEAGLPAEYCSIWRERIQEVFRTGRQMQEEEFHKTESGSLFYQSYCVPEFGLDGSVANVLIVSRNLTGHKKVEEDLRKERDIIAGVLDTAGALVFVLDKNGRIARFNRACEAMTGYSAAEMLGRTSWDFLVPPEELPDVRKAWNELREGKFPNRHENHCIARDGARHLVEWSNTAITNPQGAIEYSIATGIDITERRRMEEEIHRAYLELEERVRQRTAELQRANEQLKEENQQRLLTEQSLRMEEARLDALLRLSHLSETTTPEIAGFILEQGIALTRSEIGFVGFLSEDETVYTLHAVSKSVVKECRVVGDPLQWCVSEAGIWADAIKERRTQFINDYSQPHPSKKGLPAGHLPIARFMAVPLVDGEKIVAIAGVANKAKDYDKSDERQILLLLGGMWNCIQRQRSKEALQQAYSDLERRVEERTAELAAAKATAEAANLAKSQFLANISHELRTPMNAILSMIDLSLPMQANPTATDFLKTAKESADLLLALLNNLLDSAKIESGKLEIEAAPFSLRRVLDRATGILAVRAREKGIRFSCRVSPEIPDALIGDQVRLHQVFLNLAGNAIKFTERGEVLVITDLDSQDAEAACLKFAVRDSGIGIQDAELDRIFEPFTQADPSTARRFGGTGLGLTIASRLVGLMGGRLWAESEPGKGSVFYFTIRLPLARELPAEPQTPALAPTAATNLNILLAEDNLPNQKLTTYVLKERGHTVDIACDGQQAVNMAQENSYDVILMDIQMPGMSGFEATSAIRAHERDGKRIPVIAMTAHAMRGDRERCLAAGMDGYLSKPIDIHEMVALVEDLAGGPDNSESPPISAQASGSPSTVSATSAFDPDLALKLCLNKPHLLRDMIKYFLIETDRLLPQMQTAFKEGNFIELGTLGHRLKGTLVYLGAEPAKEAARQVECLDRQVNARANADEAIRNLEHQCEILKRILSKQV